MAFTVLLFSLIQFDRDLESVNPGTYIRPMGLAFLIAMLGIISIFAGFLISGITIRMAIKNKSRNFAFVSVIALLISFIPILAAHSIFIAIVENHKLLLND